MKNRVKEKVRRGESTVGMWIQVGHPDLAESLAKVGFDWIVFDMEHGPLNIDIVQRQIQAMGYARLCTPLIRVAWNDLVRIKRALDIGAYGIVIPYVNTKEEAIAAVKACKYPPEGNRGLGPRRAAIDDPEYVTTANNELMIIVQIETATALQNLDEILSIPGIDVALVGPADLSLNLEVFNQWNHPVFTSAIDKILAACTRHKVTPGYYCDYTNISWAIQRGFKFLGLAKAEQLIVKAAEDLLSQTHKLMKS